MWANVERAEGKLNIISSTLGSHANPPLTHSGARECHAANPNWSREVSQHLNKQLQTRA
jgi:hypothetical protein